MGKKDASRAAAAAAAAASSAGSARKVGGFSANGGGGKMLFVDTPFNYYPQPQYPFAPEAVNGLLRNKFIVRGVGAGAVTAPRRRRP